LTRITQFLLQNLSEKHEGDVFWEDSLNYIFHLSEVNEVETYQLLQSADFLHLLFRTDINYKLEELYSIFRIIGNLFYNDNIMEKVYIRFINSYSVSLMLFPSWTLKLLKYLIAMIISIPFRKRFVSHVLT